MGVRKRRGETSIDKQLRKNYANKPHFQPNLITKTPQ
jgi:hypothetical protein